MVLAGLETGAQAVYRKCASELEAAARQVVERVGALPNIILLGSGETKGIEREAVLRILREAGFMPNE